jgi:GTP-binding protein LepA
MEILTPSEYNGAIIELAQDRRGVLVDIKFLTPTRSTIIYELPLAEVITDFFDVLKSATKGYGTFGWGCLWHPRFAVGILCLAIGCSVTTATAHSHFSDSNSFYPFLYPASMEFNVIDYRPSDLVRMDVKINYEDAPPLACITHRDKAQALGRKLCAALKEHIPRQMFKIPIQACIGVKVIASESINPMRKDGAFSVAFYVCRAHLYCTRSF